MSFSMNAMASYSKLLNHGTESRELVSGEDNSRLMRKCDRLCSGRDAAFPSCSSNALAP